MGKRCIFHIPIALDENRVSPSHIRPKKMKKAFENIGYEVDVVWGTASERARAIKNIKQNIRNGVKYDFMYSESSTMPTLLTERHHLPSHPLLDFSFFSFVKKHGVKIGLFYRDVYWKFPIYKENVKGIKRQAAILMYRYDLYKYNRLLSKLYVPTLYVKKYIEKNIKAEFIDSLPPACERHEGINDIVKNSDSLKLLYIGGIGNQYKMHMLFEAVSDIKSIYLTVCCRESEWEKVLPEYSPYMSENIKIVHKKGDELEELYKDADICLTYFESDLYREMAMPFKTFEYMSYGKPIISSNRTAVGEFVEDTGIGWSIDYSKEALTDLLIFLQEHPEVIRQKRIVCIEKLEDNTWEKRAEKVALDLK